MIPGEDRTQLQRLAEGMAAFRRGGVSASEYAKAASKTKRGVTLEDAMKALNAQAGLVELGAQRLVEAFSPVDSVPGWRRRCRESLLQAHARRAAREQERERRRRLAGAILMGATAWLFLVGVAALLNWIPYP